MADGRHRTGILTSEGEGRVGCPRPLDEEADRGKCGQLVRFRQVVRVGHRQRRDGHDVLAGEPQGGPAGRQDRQARAPDQQVRGHRGRIEQVLEVVEDEQELAIAQQGSQTVDRGPPAAVDHPEDAGDGWSDEVGLADGREGDEDGAIGEVVAQVGGHPEGEGGLADAAGPGQRDEPDAALLEQGRNRRHLVLTANERRERGRKPMRSWMSSHRLDCHASAPRPEGRRARRRCSPSASARARTVDG